jgi:hypothetical protein
MATTNEEPKGECPVCGEEVLKRGMFMHIFQSDDPDGEGHYPRFEVPPDIDVEEIKVSDTEEVDMEYPGRQDLEDAHYLDTYTGKAYEGKRGLMVHLGQMAGRENIPVNVTAKHDADDFPIVEIDDDGNVEEVIKEAEGSVPPLAPYVPWYTDEEQGYVQRKKIRTFVNNLKNSQTGAASAEAIEEALLEDS